MIMGFRMADCQLRENPNHVAQVANPAGRFGKPSYAKIGPVDGVSFPSCGRPSAAYNLLRKAHRSRARSENTYAGMAAERRRRGQDGRPGNVDHPLVLPANLSAEGIHAALRVSGAARAGEGPLSRVSPLRSDHLHWL